MSEGSIDVLMFVEMADTLQAAESTTDFTAKSKLTPNDQAMREGFRPGYMSELREFSFSAGIAPDRGEDKLTPEERKKRKDDLNKKAEELKKTTGEARIRLLRERRSDAIDKAVTERTAEKVIDMQPVEFTRLMDKLSTTLFQTLVDSKTIDHIAVIKRKAAGSSNSGEPYLRLDFNKVLLTNLDWKDSDHLIVETGTFLYREVTIKYRPQNPDGTLGPIVFSHWEMKAMSVKPPP